MAGHGQRGKQGGAGTGRQWLEGENQKENKNISKVKICFEKKKQKRRRTTSQFILEDK